MGTRSSRSNWSRARPSPVALPRLEARRWAHAEKERGSRIFLMLRPNALLARLGMQDAYELPRSTRADDDVPVGYL